MLKPYAGPVSTCGGIEKGFFAMSNHAFQIKPLTCTECGRQLTDLKDRAEIKQPHPICDTCYHTTLFPNAKEFDKEIPDGFVERVDSRS